MSASIAIPCSEPSERLEPPPEDRLCPAKSDFEIDNICSHEWDVSLLRDQSIGLDVLAVLSDFAAKLVPARESIDRRV